jgi:hypothetical protein
MLFLLFLIDPQVVVAPFDQLAASFERDAILGLWLFFLPHQQTL